MKKILILLIICNLGFASINVNAQYVDTKKVDASTKLYLAKPAYKTPYGETSPEAVKVIIDRVLSYLEETTPTGVIDKNTKKPITDYKKIDKNSIIKQGKFSGCIYFFGIYILCIYIY